MTDFNTFGLLFECLALRDLKVYAESLYGKVYWYKDSRGLEIDTIIELTNGTWGTIEIKMGSNEFEYAVANLNILHNYFDEKNV